MVNNAVPPPPPPAPVTYHVLINEIQQGPFSISQLQTMVQEKTLVRNTYVWKQGMAQWDHAGNQADLARLFASVPPPPPPSVK